MEPLKLMVNGLPGNMAANIASLAIEDERFEVLPFSLTGQEITDDSCPIKGMTVRLIRPDSRDAAIVEIVAENGPFISVDYTHPTAVSPNTVFYCAHSLPFVMGTTGGEREHLTASVRKSAICAVIAPNMAKQIVGFQAMMEYAADTFPGLFDGYSLTIRESHQKGKADTSGTAKAMVRYFNRLGLIFSESDIIMEREPDVQRKELDIPEAYIGGHGWHTYTLTSGDETVTFSFTHNVNGRDVYARGTLDAILYLKEKIDRGVKGEAFSMIDVLKGS